MKNIIIVKTNQGEWHDGIWAFTPNQELFAPCLQFMAFEKNQQIYDVRMIVGYHREARYSHLDPSEYKSNPIGLTFHTRPLHEDIQRGIIDNIGEYTKHFQDFLIV